MRILNISLDKKIFEENSNVRERVLEYAKMFERFDILVLASGRKQELVNMAIWPVNSFSKIFSIIKAYFLGVKMARQYEYDLISAQDPFFTGLAGWLLKKKTGLPLQLQIHTDFLSPYFKKESLMNKLRARLAKFLVRRADGVRVVSERIKKSLEINISDLALNINVLPIFVDIGKMDNAPAKEDLRAKYPQFDFIILMASRLTREKNIGMAINAFVKIAESRPGIGLVIVGEGPEEKSLKFKVRSLKLEKNIFLEPWTNDLISYYKTADVFLLTSDYEGYGLTIVEAMACGLPIITTDVGCAGEIIKDKENGLIIPVKDEQALVNAVFKLVNDLELRNAVSNNAKQAVARFASNEKTLELYKKLSEEILTRKE